MVLLSMSNDDPKYMQIRGQTHKRLRPIHWRPSLQSCKERPGIHRTNLQSFKESFHSLVTEEFLKVGEGDLAMSPFVYPELKQKSPNTSMQTILKNAARLFQFQCFWEFEEVLSPVLRRAY